MKPKHPKVVVFIGGRLHEIPCDCGWCVPRHPRVGGAIVLAVGIAAYVLLALAVF
jgi:hypothetical protein